MFFLSRKVLKGSNSFKSALIGCNRFHIAISGRDSHRKTGGVDMPLEKKPLGVLEPCKRQGCLFLPKNYSLGDFLNPFLISASSSGVAGARLISSRLNSTLAGSESLATGFSLSSSLRYFRTKG